MICEESEVSGEVQKTIESAPSLMFGQSSEIGNPLAVVKDELIELTM